MRVPTSSTLQPQGLAKLDYLLYLGAIVPHKGVREAAWVAEVLGRRLLVAGPPFGDYADLVKARPNVEMIGEVGGLDRDILIEQAFAVMCLHNNHGGWVEPGCGVVGEAGILGTPVAALDNGCLPEIVLNNVNGWISNNPVTVTKMMQELPHFTDVTYPAHVAWSAENIIKQYLHWYIQVIEHGGWQ